MPVENNLTKLNKTVLIMAGGTGGHIFPALATAKLLTEQGVHIEWLGTEKGMEAKLVPENDYSINYIKIAGLRGKGIGTLLLMPFKLTGAIWRTFLIYKKIKPDAVLGMGGFVTGPGGIMAWLMRKPLVLHEQNAIAGLSNKLLFPLAKKVFTAFPEVFADKKKTRVIGNPLRKEITEIMAPDQRLPAKWSEQEDKTLNILVIGGSLGALALNEQIPKIIGNMAHSLAQGRSDFSKINVRHQCGEQHLQITQKNYKKVNNYQQYVSFEIFAFINNMAKNYQWADLVICRAGALTISELSSVGIASLLIPFPFAVDDHQTENAHYLANEGAACLVQQSELKSKQTNDFLQHLTRDKLLAMAVKARHLANNNAAQIIADECAKLAGEKI